MVCRAGDGCRSGLCSMLSGCKLLQKWGVSIPTTAHSCPFSCFGLATVWLLCSAFWKGSLLWWHLHYLFWCVLFSDHSWSESLHGCVIARSDARKEVGTHVRGWSSREVASCNNSLQLRWKSGHCESAPRARGGFSCISAGGFLVVWGLNKTAA